MERNVAPMETARRTHPEAAGHPSLRLADLLVQAKLPVFAVLDGAKFDDLPYSLMRLGLPIASQTDGAARGLAFDFRASTKEAQVFTGHADGSIPAVQKAVDA